MNSLNNNKKMIELFLTGFDLFRQFRSNIVAAKLIQKGVTVEIRKVCNFESS